MSTGVSISLAKPKISRRLWRLLRDFGDDFWMNFWLVVEPTPLKNMRKSNWVHHPQFSGWKYIIFELPPARFWWVSKQPTYYLHRWRKKSALKRDSESPWDPGTNSKQTCFNEQSEKISGFGFHWLRDPRTPRNPFFPWLGARRINEPTVDPSPFQTAPLFTSWTMLHFCLVIGL